jgi:DNA helicase-2/ATP-dependent DNA helicase PcrA
MVDAVIDNVHLVNAPAGSGKTTRIKSMIINHTIEFPNDNILCITYTNRAAEELQKDMSSDSVYISTIHSFLHKFIGIYFSREEVIELYFEIYGDEIRKRISNEKGDSNIARGNEKYITKFGELTFDNVQRNIESIYYNEIQFNSLYYGGLSHNDLIIFAKILFDRFPKIKRRLTHRYQKIFVDEYQDSSANVLKIFYEAVLGTPTKLFFLGDKMQQIYKNYDGSFEEELPTFNRSIKLDTNHRSIPQIIDILNSIYNNDSYKQKPSPRNINVSPDHAPRVLICDNIQEKLESEKASYPDALLLFLLNQKRFDSIGAGNLYRQLGRLDKYSFVQQASAVDVLADDTNENPDPLIKLLFTIDKIVEYFENMNLGNIIQHLKKNSKIFNKEVFTVTKHEDKGRLNNLFGLLLDKYKDTDQNCDINDVITTLKETDLVKSEYIEAISDGGEYSEVLNVKIKEFRAIAKYLKDPNVSTQHGVKGESHESVFFIAEDSTSTPVVHMYNFLKLWCGADFSLDSFESFYYEYRKWIDDTIQHLGFKLSSINKELHDQNKVYLETRTNELCEYFKDNTIFKHLCKKTYSDYLSKPNVTMAKKCFKESSVYGVLCAYRLFYVGCSRARRNLTVFIDKSKINSFSTELIEKLKTTGFSVEN